MRLPAQSGHWAGRPGPILGIDYQKHGPQYSFGTKQRVGYELTPGPADYTAESKREGPFYTCIRNRPTQREQPLRPVELPGRPWEKIAMDIVQYKRTDYLVIIDYYSRWIQSKQLTSLTSDCVITRLKAVFTTHGIPDVVISDNGRQFVSDEFSKFAKSWCFIQQTTNPYSPQENGYGRTSCADRETIVRPR